MNKKEKILLSLILFFLFTLYFPRINILTIISAAALVGYSLMFSPIKEKWAALKQRKHLQGMLLFFAWIVVSVLLSKNFNKALSFLSFRLPLFYLTVSVGTLSLKKEWKDKVLLGFAWLTSVMLLVCLIAGIYRSHFFRQPEFLYNDALTRVLGQQSIYIALLANFAIYIFVYHIFFKAVSYKPLMLFAVMFILGMSYLLASRSMTVVLLISIAGFIVYYILKRRKYLEGITLIMGLGVGLFLIFKSFPSTINRFKELAYTNFSYQSMGKESHYNMQVDSTQWNGANFRLAVWKCGWELFQQYPIAGVHIGDKKDELFKVYRQKNFQFAIQNDRNVHNNYLDILYSMGIIGLLLFLTGWLILPILQAYKYKDVLAIVMIVTFATAWITEIYLDRSLGGMLTGFFIPFLLTDKEKMA